MRLWVRRLGEVMGEEVMVRRLGEVMGEEVR